jgi:hypothetical protein
VTERNPLKLETDTLPVFQTESETKAYGPFQ